MPRTKTARKDCHIILAKEKRFNCFDCSINGKCDVYEYNTVIDDVLRRVE